MRLWRILVALAGCALAALLVARIGLSSVVAALRLSGWSGLAAIALLHLVPMALCGVGWWMLVARWASESWMLFAWMRWLREGLDAVLAVFPVTGEFVSARVLAKRGVPLAGASVVVDLTTELASQILFGIGGLIIVAASGVGRDYLQWFMLAVLIMIGQLVGFVTVQKKGLLRIVDRSLARLTSGWTGGGAAERPFHDQILTLYGSPRAVIGSMVLHLAAWMFSAAEIWLALSFMGLRIGLWPALAIESLVLTCRNVAFLVPFGAGVLEASYVAIGGLFGVPADLALAVSLLKRARDTVLGLPALLAWQLIEASYLRGRAAGAVRR